MHRWEAFLQYLKQQILDVREVQDRSSPIYTQVTHKRYLICHIYIYKYNMNSSMLQRVINGLIICEEHIVKMNV